MLYYIIYTIKTSTLLTKYTPIQARRRSQKQAEKESPYFYCQILWGFNCLFTANYANLIIIFITFEVMYRTIKTPPNRWGLVGPVGLEPTTP